MKPLMVEMFAGLSGWGEGGLAAGFRVRGYDIVDMHAQLGMPRPEGIELVIRDVRSIHGSELKDAHLIVGSPPCQEPSYRAMCWKRSKALTPKVKPSWWKKIEFVPGPRKPRKDGKPLPAMMTETEMCEWETWKRDHPLPPPDNFVHLFNECFRIQREACAAAGRYIPMVVENVRGAQAWVGRSRYNFGSYHIWGDVPALMPITIKRPRKNTGGSWFAQAHNTESGHSQNPVTGEGLKWGNCPGKRFDERPPNVAAHQERTAKAPGQNWSNFSKTGEKSPHWRLEGLKTVGHVNRRDGHEHTKHLTNSEEHEEDPDGIKQGGDWFNADDPNSISRTTGSKSPKRKAASAKIAKIPFPLAYHIAQVYYPHAEYNRCHETHTVVADVDAAGSGIGADVHLPLPGVQ